MTAGEPLDRKALEAHPLPPVADGDKETKGRILVIAGSRDVPGAAMLTATSAMRVGAGKLRIATIESAAPYLGVSMPEAMVVGLPEDEKGGFSADAVAKIREDAANSDAVVAGPGMASGEVCTLISEALLGCAPTLVLDAALLHSLADVRDREPRRAKMPVLLPHSGELASLLDCDEEAIGIARILKDRVQAHSAGTRLPGRPCGVLAQPGKLLPRFPAIRCAEHGRVFHAGVDSIWIG